MKDEQPKIKALDLSYQRRAKETDQKVMKKFEVLESKVDELEEAKELRLKMEAMKHNAGPLEDDYSDNSFLTTPEKEPSVEEVLEEEPEPA